MTILLNHHVFTNETSVGINVLKHILTQERAGKPANFNAIKDALGLSHASLSNTIHELADECIISGNYADVNGKLTYCYTVLPAYVPTVAQWIEGNYVSYEPPVWNIDDQPTKQPVLENGAPNFYLH